jgi:hypothetical protein
MEVLVVGSLIGLLEYGRRPARFNAMFDDPDN